MPHPFMKHGWTDFSVPTLNKISRQMRQEKLYKLQYGDVNAAGSRNYYLDIVIMR